MRMHVVLLSALFATVMSVDGVETRALGWKKPKTTRRYLQGPCADRLLVAFREGKVTFGDMRHERDWLRHVYITQYAFGVWLVHGEGDESYDFRTARMRVDPEGIPVQGQSWQVGDLVVDFEACSPIARQPLAHIRVKVSNSGRNATREKIGFLIRNSQEGNLIFGAPDLYRIYNPRILSWKALDCYWSRRGDAIVLGERFVSFCGDSPATWDADCGVLRFPVELKPGETKAYDLVLGYRPQPVRPDYEDAVAKTREGWRKELSRAKHLPLLQKCLLVQILQCYARATDGDIILPRQGGLQRWVWPWEQSFAAQALTQLGYVEYVEKACDFYFGEYAQAEGNVGPFGMGWVNDTANVLGIFSRYCADTGNVAYWRKHRLAAEKAFRWIRSQRAKSANSKVDMPGLFPSGRSTDNPTVFQAWGMTDVLNLLTVELYARAARMFGEAVSEEAEKEAAEYRGVIAGILERWRRDSADKPGFSIPYRPDGADQETLRKSGFFYMHPSMFAYAGFLDENDLSRVRAYMLQEGLANERGLYFHHPSIDFADLGDHIWYTTAAEYGWFVAWKRVGRNDLAGQALDACLKYAVTDEYQVGERYHDENPWYYPWSPNASGAGRILLMLSVGAGQMNGI